MKGESNARCEWVEVERHPTGEPEGPSPFLFVVVKLRNVDTGAIRIDVQIPNAHVLNSREDYPHLIRSFAVAIAGYAFGGRWSEREAFRDSMEAVCGIERLFNLFD